MRALLLIGPCVAGVALVLGFTAFNGNETKAAKPTLRIVKSAPTKVRGEHFRPREPVRITAGKLVGPTLRIPIAPLVTAKAAGPLTLSGTVRPLAPGSVVELQVEQVADVWAAVAEAMVGADGSFTAAVPEPGTYRARVAAAGGFAQGLSGRVVVR